MFIIHISDSHIGESEQFENKGAVVARRTRRLIAEINRIVPELVPASMVIHTGDVAYDPFTEAYALAREIYSECTIPIAFVPGNHDDHGMLAAAFEPPKGFIPALPGRNYFGVLPCGEVDLLLLEALPAAKEWCGTLPAEQFAALPRLLESSDRPCIVALHYPPRPMQCGWGDDRMLLLEGDQLHRTLRTHGRGRVKAVLFGHIHRSMSMITDDILYSGVGSITTHFETYPGNQSPVFLPPGLISFHVVSYVNDTVCVQVHTISET